MRKLLVRPTSALGSWFFQVQASFLEKPKNWVYHLFDPRVVLR